MPSQRRVESYRGVSYSIVIDDVPHQGYTAQAVIWLDRHAHVVQQLLGSSDLVVATRSQAERIGKRLARQWIDGQAAGRPPNH